MMRFAALLVSAALVAQTTTPAPQLPPTAERAYQAVAPRFDRDIAMDTVRFLQQYWRLAGNPGYNASIDHIRARLAKTRTQVRVDEYPKAEPAWDYSRGTATIDGDTAPVLSKVQET